MVINSYRFTICVAMIFGLLLIVCKFLATVINALGPTVVAAGR